MITIKHPVDLPDLYPLERIAPLRDLLFFDIETTGFSGDTSQLYLIGCTYHDGFSWKLIQWFADRRDAESELLTAFFTFLSRFRVLVHFNGDGFDLPYLLKRCRHLNLPFNFDSVKSVDIYKRVKPYRRLLGLENMKQKSIESFLGVNREDKFSGGQLIEVYRDYLQTGEKSLYDLLILHNEDDLKGMPSILPILNYADLLEAPLRLSENSLVPTGENEPPALSLIWESPFSIPVPLAYERGPVSLELSANRLACRVLLFQGELKYFYSNYKDYYYLPVEDTAVHKSVGEFVESSARKRATARTCYTRTSGLFLPQFGALWQPALRPDYKAEQTYAAYSPALFEDSEKAAAYARGLLEYAAAEK